ncbi:MAG: hypothetical protein AAF696_39005, partial [Bacteroidota bacterium]
FYRVVGNGMLMNRDRKAPTESPDNLVLIIDKSFQKTLIIDQKAFCRKRLSQYPDRFNMDEEYGLKEIELSGLKGYTLRAENLDDEEEEAFQVLLFDEADGYYVFFASFRKGDKKAFEDIQKVIATFKKKN